MKSTIDSEDLVSKVIVDSRQSNMATILFIYVDNFYALIIIDREITCNKLTRKPLKQFVIFSVLGKQVLHCGGMCAEHTIEDVSSESQEDG